MSDEPISQIGGGSITAHAFADGMYIVVDTTMYMSRMHEPPGMEYSSVVSLSHEECLKLMHLLQDLLAADGVNIHRYIIMHRPEAESGWREIRLSDGRIVEIEADDEHSDDEIREALRNL